MSDTFHLFVSNMARPCEKFQEVAQTLTYVYGKKIIFSLSNVYVL